MHVSVSFFDIVMFVFQIYLNRHHHVHGFNCELRPPSSPPVIGALYTDTTIFGSWILSRIKLDDISESYRHFMRCWTFLFSLLLRLSQYNVTAIDA
jgi:hypothetical protein